MAGKMEKHKEIHDNYLKRTKIQQRYLDQHIYMQQNKKQARHFIKTLFTTQEHIPDKNTMNIEQKEKLAQLSLRTKHGEIQESLTPEKYYTCTTRIIQYAKRRS